ncbi:uncharacterized protein G2W53_008703 [Senna tora]|uniref:Uncharacterized protein n=1 Tax=Senna tora TaxID=362788 RepID=A0A835CEV5_9FABA|nr:uncharacterized protein G2W53_008703 [Senna tora]
MLREEGRYEICVTCCVVKLEAGSRWSSSPGQE